MHISNDYRRFRSYKPLREEDQIDIILGDGSQTKGVGIGNIKLGRLDLKQVVHAPDMEISVLSIRKLTGEGLSVLHREDVGLVMDKDAEILLTTRYDDTEGLYIVPNQQVKNSANNTTRITVSRRSRTSDRSLEEYNLWHRRLGHINPARMRAMANSGLVDGLRPGMFNINKPPTCNSCVLGKQTMKPRSPRIAESVIDSPLQLLHIDLCGPFDKSQLKGRLPADAPTGSQYFIVIVDDFTRYVWIGFLKTKDEAAEKILEMINQMEKERTDGLKVVRIRLDQALEFHGDSVKQITSPRGITVEVPGAYAHEQNPKAERMNRTLQTAGRTMLIHAGLPEDFWPEAIRMAAVVENHGATNMKHHPTIPDTELRGRIKDVSAFRPFGCEVTITQPPEKQHKCLSEPRARKGVYLGPGTQTNTYRVWDATTKAIQIVRDVKFFEENFPATDKQRYTEYFGTAPRGKRRPATRKDADQVGGQQTSAPDSRQAMRQDDHEEAAYRQDSSTSRPSKRRRSAHYNVGRELQEETSQDGSVGQDGIISEEEMQQLIADRDRPYDSDTIVVDTTSRRTRMAAGRRKTKNWCFARAMRTKAQHHKTSTPSSYAEATDPANPYKLEWGKAIESELKALRKNETWEAIDTASTDNQDLNPLSTRWVFVKKPMQGGRTKFKARLVVRGFEQRYGINYQETFAPTATYQSIRILLALSARLGLRIHQMDVKTAFINSPLKEVVHIYAPEGLEGNGQPLRLRKALYGLKQAPRAWNEMIDEKFKDLGFKRCLSDYCIYVKDSTIVALYVDDILIISDDQREIDNTKTFLHDQFEMEDMGRVKRFLGMDIHQDEEGNVRISQKDYIESVLKKFDFDTSRPAKTPLAPGVKLRRYEDEITDESLKKIYQGMVGSLMYAATCTRPDIAYATSTLSRFNNNPGPDHFLAVKHVMRYLRGTSDFGITYKVGKPGTDGLNFHGYCDSDWAGDEDDRRSTSGYILLAAEAAVSWRSRRQNTVATSSTEAEYVSCAGTSKETLWVRQLLAELQLFYDYEAYKSTSSITNFDESKYYEDGEEIEPEFPSDRYTHLSPRPTSLDTTVIYCDNNGAAALSRNPDQMKKTKHIDIAYHFVRERVETKELEIRYISTEDMVADGLTKSLSTEKHHRHLEAMGLSRN